MNDIPSGGRGLRKRLPGQHAKPNKWIFCIRGGNGKSIARKATRRRGGITKRGRKNAFCGGRVRGGKIKKRSIEISKC